MYPGSRTARHMTHYGEETGRILSNSQHPKVSATSLNDDFEVGVTLGTGSFGRVRFATHKVSV